MSRERSDELHNALDTARLIAGIEPLEGEEYSLEAILAEYGRGEAEPAQTREYEAVTQEIQSYAEEDDVDKVISLISEIVEMPEKEPVEEDPTEESTMEPAKEAITTEPATEESADEPVIVEEAEEVPEEQEESVEKKPEISYDDAKAGGAFIIGTGRSDFPNQVNNVLAFPGLFRGALDAKATKISEDT